MEDASEQEKQTSVWAARERHGSVRGWWGDIAAQRSPPPARSTHGIQPQPVLAVQAASICDSLFAPQICQRVQAQGINFKVSVGLTAS